LAVQEAHWAAGPQRGRLISALLVRGGQIAAVVSEVAGAGAQRATRALAAKYVYDTPSIQHYVPR